MQCGDIEPVTEIEAGSFSSWSSSSLTSELERSGGVQLVAVNADDLVVGWCCASQCAGEAELLKISVSEHVKRSGIGSLLLSKLHLELEKKEVKTIFLEVRSQNISAIEFYLKFSYVQVGLRKKYYSLPEDDALIFRKQLS